MTTHHRRIVPAAGVLFGLLLSTMIPTAALSELVPVEIWDPVSQSVGRGIAIGSSNTCRVVAPYHVIASGGPFDVTFPGGIAGRGELVWDESEQGVDLGVLLLEANTECSQATLDGSGIASLLGSAENATIVTQGVDLIQRTRAFVSRVETDLIALEVDQDAVREGFSGSVVTVDRKPVGMLLRVDTQDRTVEAFRLDRALAILAPALRSAGVTMDLTVTGPAGSVPAGIELRTAELLDALHPELEVTGGGGSEPPGHWAAELALTEIVLELDSSGRESVAGRIYASRYALRAELRLSPPGGSPRPLALDFEERKNTHTPPPRPALSVEDMVCRALQGRGTKILQALGIDEAPQPLDC